MTRVQTFFCMIPFQYERFKATSRCVLPLCVTYQHSKEYTQPTKGSIKAINPDTDRAIHVNQLRSGNMVSADHFESRLKGRT